MLILRKFKEHISLYYPSISQRVAHELQDTGQRCLNPLHLSPAITQAQSFTLPLWINDSTSSQLDEVEGELVGFVVGFEVGIAVGIEVGLEVGAAESASMGVLLLGDDVG